jgi:hypothetical protein
MGAALPSPGAIIGNNFAGTVVRIHPDTTTEIHVGDVVCGTVHGSNPLDPTTGAFAQYIRASVELVFRVPKGVKIAEASFGFGAYYQYRLLVGRRTRTRCYPRYPSQENTPSVGLRREHGLKFGKLQFEWKMPMLRSMSRLVFRRQGLEDAPARAARLYSSLPCPYITFMDGRFARDSERRCWRS